MDDIAPPTAPAAPAAQPDSPAAGHLNTAADTAETPSAAAAPAATPQSPPPAAAPAANAAADTGQQAQAEGPQAPQSPAADITITMPEGVEVNAPMLQSYTDFAKQSGLSQQQAQAAAEWFMQENAAQHEAYKKSGETYLRQAWGTDFAANMETSRSAIAQFDKMFGNRLSTQLVNTGLADAPVVAELFHFLGVAISEEGMGAGSPSAGQQAPQSLLEHVQNTINKSVTP